MFWSYLQSAFRNMRKNRLLSLINIAGLALSFVCVFLIVIYCSNEFGYDKYNSNADRIYRLVRSDKSTNGETICEGSCPAFMAGSLCDNYPAMFHKASRLWHYWGLGFNVKHEENVFNEKNLFFADPAFIDIFDIKLLQGDPKTALLGKGKVIISQSTAQVYFGNEDAIDQSLTVNNGYELTVTGIFDDIPRQSHLHPDFMASFETLENMSWSKYLDGSEDNFCYVYLLSGKQDIGILQQSLDSHQKNYLSENYRNSTSLHLQPLSQIHLQSNLQDEIEQSGNLKALHILMLTGLFLLIISAINYTNICLAVNNQRQWSFILRRILGARKINIVNYFMAEAAITCTCALLLALAILELMLPHFSRFMGIFFVYENIWSLATVLLFLGGGYLVTLLINIHPALIIAGVKLPEYQGKSAAFLSKTGWKKLLVIFQLTLTLVILISSIVFVRQVKYIEKFDLRYDQDNIFVFPVNNTPIAGENYNEFIGALETEQDVISATGMRSIAGVKHITENFSQDGVSNWEKVPFYLVRDNFTRTFDLDILSGRDFYAEFAEDKENSVLINELYAQNLGWDKEEAIGKKIFHQGWGELNVIGIISDFHFETLHEKAKPVVIKQIWESREAELTDYIAVRLVTGADNRVFSRISEIWKENAPESAYEFFSLKMRLNSTYSRDILVSRISVIIAIIAIITANLGLLGLLLFIGQQKKKEISIRRVMGATIGNIISLMSSVHIQLMLISFVIAIPVSLLFAEKWLRNYAYRINVTWDIFLISGAILIIMAGFTIIIQSLVTSSRNPINAIKDE